MRKILVLFVVPGILVLAILGSGYYLLGKRASKGGLQVTSVPKSRVFLNDKLVDETPMCKCDPENRIASGKYNLKLIPLQQDLLPFEEKITIDKQVLTVVDRTFAKGASAEGSVINLYPIDKKNIELQVISFPKDTSVFLDGSALGKTPLIKGGITESDHEITLKKEGYKEKTIRIRTALGFRLTSVVYLGIAPISSASASITPTPATQSAQTSKILILATPTGFLRVRSGNSITAAQIATVNPGEEFDLVAEEEGWFQIRLADGVLGWISSSYAQKK